MKKYSKETIVGIFVFIGLVGITYMTVKLGNVAILGDSSYSIFARFTSVSGLRVGSGVQMLGLEVGKVERMTMNQEDQLAVVELKIKKDVMVYEDAMASIKTEGLIGDKYVQIDPGGAEDILPPGGTIIDTQPAIDIGDLIGKYAFGDVKK